MKKHRWENDKCINCRVTRKKKTIPIHIKNEERIIYKKKYIYITYNGTEIERPDCM